jgi:gluconate 5-dehydrogenase
MRAPHPFKLTGLVALVTGSGRGLGLAIAKALADAGALVIVNGRNPEPLARTVEAIEASGGHAQAVAFDVADTAAAKHSMAEIVSRYGRLDILVNNVGLRDWRELFEFALDDVRTLLEVDHDTKRTAGRVGIFPSARSAVICGACSALIGWGVLARAP